jgi:phosphocarrier protein FPr/phosphocarrier protein
VRTAREFDADVYLRAHGRRASARSAVALMSLGVRRNDDIEIEAQGPDAERVVAALETILCGHSAHESPASNALPTTGLPGVREPAALLPGADLMGVVASPGFALGQAFRIVRRERDVEELGHGLTREALELTRARGEVRAQLRVLVERAEGPQHEIAAAHLEFVDDPELEAAAADWIAQGKSAGYAWRQAVRSSIDALRALGDARLVERVDDLLDLESQVLGVLAGDQADAGLAPPGHAILIANDLLPSQLATLAPGGIAGICIARGGATSHVAILAAAMRIPALVSMGPGLLAIDDGTPLLLDADAGLLRVDPPAAAFVEAERTIRERRVREVADRAAALDDCVTADGVRIEVFANVATAADARDAVQLGAEGCGLLRTEFLFLDRQTAPGVEEQTREYQRIVDAFAHRPVVIRTLDAGGDKPIPYLPMPHEDNPALGLRGVRTSLLHPDLLRTQLQGILGVRPIASCRVMLPMISNTDEIRRVRVLLDEVAVQAGSRATLPLGVMIETPAAALIADQICDVADFVSIGTNDLTQYTLAMDRTQPELAGQVDGLHPAVLRLIARAAEAAHARARPVAVCGGLATDALAVPVLVGLGVRELSAVPAFIPRLKTILRGCTIEECRDLARRALELDSAASVRAMMRRRFGANTDQHNEQVSA